MRQILRLVTVLGCGVVLAACGSSEDPAEKAMRIRKDFERRFASALAMGHGDIESTVGTTVTLHAAEDGCAKIFNELQNTKAPPGVTIKCGNLAKGEQWRLWTNEVGVLEAQ